MRWGWLQFNPAGYLATPATTMSGENSSLLFKGHIHPSAASCSKLKILVTELIEWGKVRP
ncbi:hypothetical protein Pyn_19482 [Prunus yedoensis var. nudiflora]|uniref:Uncharacterized protein n=1 Tax=Prunus yedoensis var. nudiflora TaxID=2094558 RepID=A0A314UC90_PRUYE|nr:hypothetical protein Pyn_19482 [Prunus yedoensis var. nudiflora]